MTSQSGIGQTRITLQFDLNRDIDGAARDVQAAINAARADLPASLRTNPTYRKVNPADAPILILALTSKTLTQGQMYDAASNVLAAAAVADHRHRPGHHRRLGAAGGARRAQSAGAVQIRHRARRRARGARLRQRQQPERHHRRRRPAAISSTPTTRRPRRPTTCRWSSPTATAPRCGCPMSPHVNDSVEDVRNLGLSNGQPSVLVILFRQPGANIIDTIDSVKAELPHLRGGDAGRRQRRHRHRPHHDDPRIAARHRTARW